MNLCICGHLIINRSLGLRQALRTRAQVGVAVLTLVTLPWVPGWSCGGASCPSPAAQTCVWFQQQILDPRWAPALPLGRRLFLVSFFFFPSVFLFRHDGCLPVCPRGDRFCYFSTGSLKLLLLRREGSSKAGEDEHSSLSRPPPTSHPEAPLSLPCP